MSAAGRKERDRGMNGTQTADNNTEKKDFTAPAVFPVRPKKEILPSQPEKLLEVEKAILRLSEELGNLEELKSQIMHSFEEKNLQDEEFESQLISYFNRIITGFEVFNKQFDREIDYNRELEERVKRQEYERQVTVLEKALNEEHARTTLFIANMTKKVEDAVEDLKEKSNALKTADSIIQEEIQKFRHENLDASKGEMALLRQKTSELLEKFTQRAQETLQTVKDNSTTFLKQCQKENEDLIKKIPKIRDGKFPIETALIVLSVVLGLCGTVFGYRIFNIILALISGTGNG